jgi:hypothetical protein
LARLDAFIERQEQTSRSTIDGWGNCRNWFAGLRRYITPHLYPIPAGRKSQHRAAG